MIGSRRLIEDIVNNYAYINSSFGPTLLNWMKRRTPDVYERILEGDRLSLETQEGHGNAIAQVYNHMILPLANYRDKRMQVAWGFQDFEFRFGRKSESMWLPETAVNLESIRVLIDSGIRYVILSPFQALRVRPMSRYTREALPLRRYLRLARPSCWTIRLTKREFLARPKT